MVPRQPRAAEPAVRPRPRFDPVLVIGVAVSAGLGVGFYFFDSLAPAMATFAALLGLVITLQVQEILRERRRAEHESRMGSMLAKIERSHWLPDLVEAMLTSVTKVEQTYAGTPAIEACRNALDECRVRLAELEHGRFQYPYSDNELALRLCQTAQREFLAVSVPAIDLRWWVNPEGTRYWQCQQEALGRGVTIRRVFIYSDWSDELDAVARVQRDAGVAVRRVHLDALPPGTRGIIGIWDATCGLEVVYDASGEAVRFSYSVAAADLDRLQRQFELVERMAIGIDEPEPAVGVTGPPRSR